MQKDVYFKGFKFDLLTDRLIIRLEAFDLDLRWSADPVLIKQVTGRYNNFKEEVKQHIPPPPAEPQITFIVLTIRDDDSKPNVINPMINFVDTLDQFNLCVFFDRVGPLSRK